MAASAYLGNVAEMLFANNYETNWFAAFCFPCAHFTYWIDLVAPPTRLFFKPSKIIVNRVHIFVLILFFLLTAFKMTPFATRANWICLLYSFILCVESSVATSTKQFDRDNFTSSEEAEHCGTNILGFSDAALLLAINRASSIFFECFSNKEDMSLLTRYASNGLGALISSVVIVFSHLVIIYRFKALKKYEEELKKALQDFVRRNHELDAMEAIERFFDEYQQARNFFTIYDDQPPHYE
ncbi:unnamed protein product [Caenorhabditis sp. 36 PRJEB53466]|nr:unnamed protein product [Caenorhabditis sp. 36 PRJEB53466]